MAEFPYRVPGFILEREVGKGGFGIVYEAKERSDLGTTRAVKVIDPSPFNSDMDKARARFKREALSLSRLQHPAIVKYVASGFTDDERRLPYLVTDFVVGSEFQSTYSASDLVKIAKMADAIDALGYAHSAGVFHRDIKPSNILVRENDGQPVIVDFGMAFLDDDESGTEALSSQYAAGSAAYIPPEVIAREQKGRANHDIFSCTVMLYQLLSGRLPNIQSYESIAMAKQNLSTLDDIVRSGLAAFDKRYQTAAELATALRGAIPRIEAAEHLVATNPLAENFRQKLILQKENARQKKMEADAKNEAIQNKWDAFNSIVQAGGEAAFHDMLAVAQEASPDFVFEKVAEQTRRDENEPLALFSWKSPTWGKIHFGLSSKSQDQPLGRSNASGPAVPWPKPIGNHGALIRPSQTPRQLHPSWIIWREGKNQSPARAFVGAIAAVESSSGYELFSRSARWPGSGQAGKLSNVEDVRAYVTEVLGRQFVHEHQF